jgi:predicted lipoprotein with Yx(FWY)xxD motif
MRTSIFLMVWAIAVMQQAPTVAAQTTPTAIEMPSHPSEVAFVDEGAKGYVYRKFPTGERLYVSDLDQLNKSLCNGGCASAWPPVYAPNDAVAVGEWKPIRRDDGRLQWALQGRPVYMRFHDSPEDPTGYKLDGVWHLVAHVQVKAPAKR